MPLKRPPPRAHLLATGSNADALGGSIFEVISRRKSRWFLNGRERQRWSPSSPELSAPPEAPCAPLSPPTLAAAGWLDSSTAVVALLLATPGVDPLSKRIPVSGLQKRLRGSTRLPGPRPFPLLQGGKTPLGYAQSRGMDAAAALLRADPRVAAALAAAGKA